MILRRPKSVFDAVEQQADKDAACAAFHNGQLAESKLDHVKAMRKYSKAVERDGDNSEYLLAAGKLACIVADYAQAEAWLKHLLQIREAEGQGDSAALGTALNDLAALYFYQGRYEEAEPLFHRSLEIREKSLGKDHPDAAESMNNLAGFYSYQARYKEIEPLYLLAIEIDEK